MLQKNHINLCVALVGFDKISFHCNPADFLNDGLWPIQVILKLISASMYVWCFLWLDSKLSWRFGNVGRSDCPGKTMNLLQLYLGKVNYKWIAGYQKCVVPRAEILVSTPFSIMVLWTGVMYQYFREICRPMGKIFESRCIYFPIN